MKFPFAGKNTYTVVAGRDWEETGKFRAEDGNLTDEAAAELLTHWPDITEDSIEIHLHFDYEGTHDTGVCSGPVERCFPPETKTDYTLVEAEVLWLDPDGNEQEHNFQFSEQVAKDLFRENLDSIEEMDL